MTSRNFQDLSEAQRQTVKALQTLLVQLRRTSGTQKLEEARRPLAALERSRTQTASRAPTLLRSADLEQVLRPLIARTGRDPAAGAHANAVPQTKPLLGAPAETQLQAGRTLGGGEDFARAITTATSTARNLGRILSQNTKAMQQSREAISTAQSLLAGLFSSLGQGGGSSGILGSGLGLVPLGLRIAGLFRKRRAEPQSFSPFELPPSLIFARAITTATSTARNLGRILSQNTKAMQQSREAISTAQSLLAGLFSSLGQGGGSSGILGSGLGLVPLGLRIAGLFRKRRAEPQSFSPFELPPSLSLEVANTGNILAGFPRVARKQAGEIKVIRQETPATQPQVTVNVNAMDAQSFLDRSEDIASAVRDAMLHMHPLNDVIGEL